VTARKTHHCRKQTPSPPPLRSYNLAFGMIDRLHKAGLSVVVMSGYSVPDPIAEASAILEKPFCEAELLKTLADVRRSRPTC